MYAYVIGLDIIFIYMRVSRGCEKKVKERERETMKLVVSQYTLHIRFGGKLFFFLHWDLIVTFPCFLS